MFSLEGLPGFRSETGGLLDNPLSYGGGHQRQYIGSAVSYLVPYVRGEDS